MLPMPHLIYDLFYRAIFFNFFNRFRTFVFSNAQHLPHFSVDKRGYCVIMIITTQFGIFRPDCPAMEWGANPRE